jgi:hypothetical protein
MLLLAAISGCDPAYVDPTDPANFSSVAFVNDTKVPLELFECDDLQGHGCHDMVEGPLAPGDHLERS